MKKSNTSTPRERLRQIIIQECGCDSDEADDYSVPKPNQSYDRKFSERGHSVMAKEQLFNTARKAQSLHDRLDDEDALPEWVLSLIAVSDDHVSSVSDYMDYKLNRQNSNPIYETRERRELKRRIRQKLREGFLDTVKGYMTGASKLADVIYTSIAKNFSLKNEMYDTFVVQRGNPKSAIESFMVTKRKQFDRLFSAANVSNEQRLAVVNLLIPKFIDLMKDMDDYQRE